MLAIESNNEDSAIVVSSKLSGSHQWPWKKELVEPKRRQQIPNNKSFVIIFEVEPILRGLLEGIFARGFITRPQKFRLGLKKKA